MDDVVKKVSTWLKTNYGHLVTGQNAKEWKRDAETLVALVTEARQ